jgi:hypothetical protein
MHQFFASRVKRIALKKKAKIAHIMAFPLPKIVNKLLPAFKSKFKHILQARSNSSPIGFKHDDCSRRIWIRYVEFVRLHDTYGDSFLTHTDHPGIIVIAPPEPILNPTRSADVWLREHLGPGHDIACVIGVEGSGTVAENTKLQSFLAIAKDKSWEPLKKGGARGETGVGNHGKWSGHYFISLQGSGTSPVTEGCVELTNDAIEYTSKEDQVKIKSQLLYMMLQVPDVERLFKTPPTVEELEQLRVYCETNGLLDWTKFPVSPIDANGRLQCWSEHPITAGNFLTDQYDQSYTQKCHVDSVASAGLDFDPVARRLKTVVRPYGFMWGIMKFNMLQGKGSIEDARKDLNLHLKTEIAELERRLAKYEAV